MRIARKTMAGNRTIHVLLSALYSTCFLSVTFVVSSADARSVTYNLDIPSQSLKDALEAFALASHHKLLYSAGLVDGKVSPGLKGQYTAEQALTILVSGTNLDREVTSDGVVLIRAAGRPSSTHAAPTSTGDLATSANLPTSKQQRSAPDSFRLAGATVGSSQGAPAVVASDSKLANTQDESGASLAEIIVTSQKRAQDILSVPISITAITGDSLEQQNIKDINDLARIAPGVSLIPAAQATGSGRGIFPATGDRTVVIRGIASLAGSPTTGVYLDDTPIVGREVGTIFPAVFDLERVEVLRGPQGTLFGAGSEGGTVRYITPAPSLVDHSAYAHAESAFTAGGAPSFEVGAAGGGPLINDRVGVRASLWSRYDGGYVDRYNFFTNDLVARDTNSRTSYVGHLSLLTKLTDQLSVTASIFAQEIDRADSDLWWTTKGVDQSYYAIPQPTKDHFYLPSLSVDYDLGLFSIKSITSYLSRSASGSNQFFHSYLQALYYPQVPNYYADELVQRHQDNFTQELRFTSNGDGRLNWVAGIYYASNREESYFTQREPLANAVELAVTGKTITQLLGSAPIGPNQDIIGIDNRVAREEELAEFVDATFKVTQKFKISAGVRASHTEFGFSELGLGPIQVGASGHPVSSSGGTSEHPIAPKVGISYDLETGGTVYATYAKGFRIGGTNNALSTLCTAQLQSLGITGRTPSYDSDSVKSYEVGAKARLLDNSVLVSGSAFWIDWSNIQANIPLNSCASSFTSNLGAAVSKGFDVQGLYAPITGLELSASMAMTSAAYTKTLLAPNSTTTVLALDGQSLPFTPKWQGALGISYSQDIGNDMSAYTRVDWTYTGSYYRTPPLGVTGYLASIRNGQSINQTQLRAGLRAVGGTWDISLFAKNLTNNHTPVVADVGTVPNTYGFTAVRVSTLQPRTIGAAVTYRFGK